MYREKAGRRLLRMRFGQAETGTAPISVIIIYWRTIFWI
jgi:hypothetical protein